MLIIIIFNNQFQETVIIYSNLGTNDWVLFCTLGLVSVLFQNFRYISLKYDEPAKLSQYQYITTVYSLIFDLYVFNVGFDGI